ncbi:hypothetical protein X975_06151, partial [Stegodyphus mimosarum]
MLMYADDEEKDIRSIRSGAFGSSHSVRSRLGAQHNKAEMLYQNRKLAISDEKHKTKVLIARKGHFDFNTCRNAANHHCRQSPLLRDDDERVARRKLAISDEKHVGKVLIARKRHCHFNTWKNLAESASDEDKDLHLKIKRRSQEESTCQSPLLRDDDERIARKKLAISDEKHVRKVLIARKRHCHFNTWKNLAESASDEDKDLHLKIKRRSQEESSCQSPLLRDDDERVARKKLAISDEKHVGKVLIARKRHCHFNTWKNLAESASDEDKDLHLKIKRRSQEESSCQSPLLRDDDERVARKKLAISDEKHVGKVLIARKRHCHFNTWKNLAESASDEDKDLHLKIKRRSQEESSCQSPLLRDDDERVARKKLAISDEKHVRKVLIARKRHCHFNTWKNLAESASDEDKDLHLKIKRRSQEESSCQSPLLRDDDERVARKKLAISDEKHVGKVLIARKRHCHFNTWKNLAESASDEDKDLHLKIKRRSQEESSCQSSLLRDDAERVARKRYSRFSTWSDSDDTDESDEDDEKLNVN